MVVTGLVRGLEQGGRVQVWVPTTSDPSVEFISCGYTSSALAKEVTLDDSGAFSIRIELPAKRASLRVKCGAYNEDIAVLAGDSLNLHFNVLDSIGRWGPYVRGPLGVDTMLTSCKGDFLREDRRLWSESMRAEYGLKAVLDSSDACRRTLLMRFDASMQASGIGRAKRQALLRYMERWMGSRYFSFYLGEDKTPSDVSLLEAWRARRFYRVAPKSDRYMADYSRYSHTIAIDRFIRQGERDTSKFARLNRAFVVGFKGELEANRIQRTALAVVWSIVEQGVAMWVKPDTLDYAVIMAERAKRGYHTRADSVARAAFELYRAGLRRGHAERSFNNQAWSLGSQSELTPAGERTKAILVWCWLANSKAAMRQVGPLAEIEHRLRPLDVRSVHVCFDNGDRAMREELYQLGLQGEYWYSDRKVRGQLLDMLGEPRLDTPRLLLLSPDGRVLDAALPDATDVEGVVKRVGERL